MSVRCELRFDVNDDLIRHHTGMARHSRCHESDIVVADPPRRLANDGRCRDGTQVERNACDTALIGHRMMAAERAVKAQRLTDSEGAWRKVPTLGGRLEPKRTRIGDVDERTPPVDLGWLVARVIGIAMDANRSGDRRHRDTERGRPLVIDRIAARCGQHHRAHPRVVAIEPPTISCRCPQFRKELAISAGAHQVGELAWQLTTVEPKGVQ
mmetsp:Transcript_45235/g.149941  ORF Transcript_45235/g.149941 Transcript_45235/m.149941 type:complete len:211 (-) Transcript_45235:435-1067(-)